MDFFSCGSNSVFRRRKCHFKKSIENLISALWMNHFNCNLMMGFRYKFRNDDAFHETSDES